MKPAHETKEARFKRVAEARVNKLLAMLRLVGNLSNSNVYAYTQDQAEQIYAAILAELSLVRDRLLKGEKHRKKTFHLGQAYRISEEEWKPTFSFPLPDGTVLRAVGYPTDTYPTINIFWDNGTNDPTEAICFAEFNPEKKAGQQVCVGAYQHHSEEPSYYEPYIKELNI